MADTKMNDQDMNAMIQVLRNGPQMGRLQHDEIRDALRALEAAGYVVTRPASKQADPNAPVKSIFAPAPGTAHPAPPGTMTAAQIAAAPQTPSPMLTPSASNQTPA